MKPALAQATRLAVKTGGARVKTPWPPFFAHIKKTSCDARLGSATSNKTSMRK